MKAAYLALAAFLLAGCDARIGKNAQMPDVAIYPGAKIVSNGENAGVIGANLDIESSKEPVIAFYAKELGADPNMAKTGSLEGTKDGHHIKVQIAETPKGMTHVAIIEPK